MFGWLLSRDRKNRYDKNKKDKIKQKIKIKLSLPMMYITYWMSLYRIKYKKKSILLLICIIFKFI